MRNPAHPFEPIALKHAWEMMSEEGARPKMAAAIGTSIPVSAKATLGPLSLEDTPPDGLGLGDAALTCEVTLLSLTQAWAMGPVPEQSC